MLPYETVGNNNTHLQFPLAVSFEPAAVVVCPSGVTYQMYADDTNNSNITVKCFSCVYIFCALTNVCADPEVFVSRDHQYMSRNTWLS